MTGIKTPRERCGSAVLCLALMGFLTAAVMPNVATAADVSEYELKAAFLYHIARLVSWPEAAFESIHSDMVVTILGRDPFGHALEDTLGSETIGDRRLRFERVADLDDLAPTQILFVAAPFDARLPAVLARIQGQPVLVITDHEAGARAGADIGFKTEGTRVRFVVNRKAAEARGLKLRSHLLLLAESLCETETSPGG